jgi:hypothetical protein
MEADMLWLTLAATMSGATPLPPIVADFQSICGYRDQAPQAILAEAKRQGWTSRAPAAGDADTHTQRLVHAKRDGLELSFVTSHSAGDTQQSCGLKLSSPLPGILAAAQDALGFKPRIVMESTASFLAIRTGNVWRSADGMLPAGFEAAKAEGRFYLIIAHTTAKDASIFAMHPTATTAP